MMRSMDVYLGQYRVGQLIQKDQGQLAFGYAETWLSHPGAMPLSHSLPLRKERFNQKECHGFFAGILPEQDLRETIARNLGISAGNDFALLEQIGGECAGAVTFLPTGIQPVKGRGDYRPLSQSELADILRMLPRRPLLAGEKGVRLSLAGAQHKIAVHVSETISLPLGGSPSTHILKPAIARFPEIVFNECFCLKLAGAVQLPTALAEVGQVEGIDYLLVKRYDRMWKKNSAELLERLHQEDFCQALGVGPDQKYQGEGGPSLKQCFALLREISTAPVIDLQQLLDAVIFNFLIGNHDAHGKNFSLLYEVGTRMAPLYDLVCTIFYPEHSARMAMKLGGEYASEKIRPRHFEQMSEEAGFSKPMVKQRVVELGEAILEKSPPLVVQMPRSKPVGELIKTRCQSALGHFKRG